MKLAKRPLSAVFFIGRDERITLRHCLSCTGAIFAFGKTGDTPVSPIAGSRTSFPEVQILRPNSNKKTASRRLFLLVGTRGFEPPTSCTPCKRSTRLNYVPLYFQSFNTNNTFFMRLHSMQALWNLSSLRLLRCPCSLRFSKILQTKITSLCYFCLAIPG